MKRTYSSQRPTINKYSVEEFIIGIIFSIILICLLWYFKEHGFNFVTGNFMMIMSVCFLVVLCLLFKRDHQKEDIDVEEKLETTKVEHFYKPGNETVKKAIARVVDFFKASKSITSD